jgi:hypothetical protein
MCTVTFIARQRGYLLGMNRDEKLARAQGLPPARHTMAGRTILRPCEPAGGTWIAVNDSGASFALINWYSISARVVGKTVSRGEVVNSLAMATAADDASAGLSRLRLTQINPFRLIGFFPNANEVVEWRWNLEQVVAKRHPWRSQQWISSGFDEPAAQRLRSRTFRHALGQKSTGSLDWLRRLHRSHSPQRGPFSTCMHRAEAATVSYTEINVSSRHATMRYHSGPPCLRCESSSAVLTRTVNTVFA